MEDDQLSDASVDMQLDEEAEEALRYSPDIRKQMVRALLAGLHQYGELKREQLLQQAAKEGTPATYPATSGAWQYTAEYLIEGAHWPNSKVFRPVWKALIADVRLQPQGEDRTDRGIREAAIRWTKAFLVRGSVMDLPPHIPGEQLERNREHLVKIQQILMEGHTDKHGNKTIYRSLEDAHSKSKAFKQAYAATKLTSFQGLWSQLKQLYPKLNKVQIKLKKARDHALVQV